MQRFGTPAITSMDCIENRTYDEIKVGDTATLVRILSPQNIQLFANLSGDVNPAHVDPEYAKSSTFGKVTAQSYDAARRRHSAPA